MWLFPRCAVHTDCNRYIIIIIIIIIIISSSSSSSSSNSLLTTNIWTTEEHLKDEPARSPKYCQNKRYQFFSEFQTACLKHN